MKPSTAYGHKTGLALGIVLFGGLTLSDCKKEDEPEETKVDTLVCQRDEYNTADTALEVTEGSTSEGSICPPGDTDWYAFNLSPDHRLLEVSLIMDNQHAPIVPTYDIYSADAKSEAVVGDKRANADSVSSTEPISDVHCLEPGDYFLAVRGMDKLKEDRRNHYQLQISAASEPDQLEENNQLASATSLTSDQTVEAYISCSGDQDWYALEVLQPDVLEVRIQSQPAQYQPKLQILEPDQNLLSEEVNPKSSIEATDITLSKVLPASGTYYIAVSDDDDVEADPSVPYTLSIKLIHDEDQNEPNDHPNEATPLSASPVDCTDQWSSDFEVRGTVGSRGDSDFFLLPIENCNYGVLEAVLEYDYSGRSDQQAWQLQNDVQLSVALLRSHSATPCQEDTVCQTLNIGCDEETGTWDCQGYFNTCSPDGFCTGAVVCLPDKTCGALQTERHYREAAVPATVTGPPPLHRVKLSAPIFGGERTFLRVSDFQSDGGDPSAIYTLRVKIRSDPDPYDRSQPPNNLYGNVLTTENFPEEESQPVAVTIPVHDCTEGADCCDSSTWIEGTISYQNDMDWYRYDHPCMDEQQEPTDCLLRLYYETEDGQVDFGFYLYQGSYEWYSFELVGDDTFGDDECLYAYQGHHNPYYILIRDYLGEQEPVGEDIGILSRWDSEQRYRFCLEKTSNQCEAPCEQTAEGQCTSP